LIFVKRIRAYVDDLPAVFVEKHRRHLTVSMRDTSATEQMKMKLHVKNIAAADCDTVIAAALAGTISLSVSSPAKRTPFGENFNENGSNLPK
jgi:hypothetical protein